MRTIGEDDAKDGERDGDNGGEDGDFGAINDPARKPNIATSVTQSYQNTCVKMSMMAMMKPLRIMMALRYQERSVSVKLADACCSPLGSIEGCDGSWSKRDSATLRGTLLLIKSSGPFDSGS